MTEQSEHWNKIYRSTPEAKLGWHEDDYSQTFKFVESIALQDKRIFIPGAGTSSLAEILYTKGAHLILNDLSKAALQHLADKLAARYNTYTKKCEFLVQSIAEPLPINLAMVDLWIDRAVLHFLTQENEIDQYFKNLKTLVKPEGHVLLAEFATDGAEKCAGLPVHRYRIEEMSDRLGSDFTCIAHEHYTFYNPAGQPRPYVYGWFRRG